MPGCAARTRLAAAAVGGDRGDAHDAEFVDDGRPGRRDVFELLGLAGQQVDRLAVLRFGQAASLAVQDRFADEVKVALTILPLVTPR